MIFSELFLDSVVDIKAEVQLSDSLQKMLSYHLSG